MTCSASSAYEVLTAWVYKLYQFESQVKSIHKIISHTYTVAMMSYTNVSFVCLFIVVILSIINSTDSFHFRPSSLMNSNRRISINTPVPSRATHSKTSSLKMVDDQTLVYGSIIIFTLLPSLIFVKFVGDAADSSRGSLSDKTKETFKRKMMQQPGINLGIPTTEEDALKKQIAKAYMQDKDVDVAVLEEKLKKRAQWRKEMMAQSRQAGELTKYAYTTLDAHHLN